MDKVTRKEANDTRRAAVRAAGWRRGKLLVEDLKLKHYKCNSGSRLAGL